MPVISTNTAANSALRYLNLNSAEQSSSLSKLASGSRITKASDDAAGLAIGTRIQSDVTVLSQAATNASQATAILQTADGGMARVTDILQRMKSLATQSDSGSVTDSERTYIDAEYQELLEEIDGIASSTRYNGVSLLNGDSTYSSSAKVATSYYDEGTTFEVATGTNAFTVSYTDDAGTTSDLTVSLDDGTYTLEQIAAAINADTDTNDGKISAYIEDSAEGQRLVVAAAAKGASVATSTTASTLKDSADDAVAMSFTALDQGVNFMVGTSTSDIINVSIDDIDTTALGLSGTDVTTQDNAETAIEALDGAISALSQARAEIGATMSRFEFRSETIDTTVENLESAQSAVMDADVAAEKSQLSSADVKTQAAIAALSQANQMPQNLLTLLKS